MVHNKLIQKGQKIQGNFDYSHQHLVGYIVYYMCLQN